MKTDHCVFTNNDFSIFLVLYVDDGLLVYESEKEAKEILDHIQREFEITISPARQYIGLEIDQMKDCIKISQEQYVKKILDEFKMSDCKTVSTPSTPETKESQEDTKAPYKEAVGALMFLSNVSRPDISYATGKVARAAAKPTETNWMEVKRIFRYLKGTMDMSITFPKKEGICMKAYSDADYAGDETSRKSTTGSVITINDSPVSWISRLQRTVSLSTTEAEYNALAETTKEVMWTRSLLEEINEKQEKPTTIFCDNQSTLKLVNNDEACRRTKHMAVKVHFVKDEIDSKTIRTEYVETEKQKADFLTKSLPSPSFIRNRQGLGMSQKKLALMMCLMVFTGHIIETHGLFHPHPPIIWRKSQTKVISGAELIHYKLQLISPCDAYSRLNSTEDYRVLDLTRWCERYYKEKILNKLEAHKTHHERSKRDLTSLLYMGASMGLLPNIAIPVAIVVVVGVVVVGIVGYVRGMNKISNLEEENLQLKNALKTLEDNQIEITKRMKVMEENINTLIERHNILAQDVNIMRTNLANMIIFTTEISNKLSHAGHLLDESLNEWKEGRVSETLFRALEIQSPCNGTCSFDQMMAINWKQTNNSLEIGILALKTDLHKKVVEADPFILYDGDSCQYQYEGDSRLTVDKNDLECLLKETKEMNRIFTASGGNRCEPGKENPWKHKECDKTAPEPQIKNLGMENIVYCRGHQIQIGSLAKQNCPDYAFSLSVTQNFTTGNYSFRAILSEINLHRKHMSIPQQEINSIYLSGVNPYLVKPTEMKEMVLKRISFGTEKITLLQIIQTAGIFMAMAGIIWMLSLKHKNNQSTTNVQPTQEIDAPPSYAEMIV